MSQNFLSEMVGSFSQGAGGNPTVAMVEAAFKHHQLAWRYVNLEVTAANLEAAVKGAWAMGFQGFNCSLPHKVRVIEYLDELGESAAVIGAVNCVVRRNGKFIGENTDGKGFLKSLEALVEVAGKSVVMFGAGGAARAIAVELGLAGTKKISIVNRSAERGMELVGMLRKDLKLEAEWGGWTGDYEVPEGTDVVINATSIGLYEPEARIALKMGTLRAGMVVADVVFNPARTRLIREAEAQGCRVVDGLGMLVNQGVVGVKLWTGVEPDAAVMRQTLEQVL